MGKRLHLVFGQFGLELWFPWQGIAPIGYNGENLVSNRLVNMNETRLTRNVFDYDYSMAGGKNSDMLRVTVLPCH